MLKEVVKDVFLNLSYNFDNILTSDPKPKLLWIVGHSGLSEYSKTLIINKVSWIIYHGSVVWLLSQHSSN